MSFRLTKFNSVLHFQQFLLFERHQHQSSRNRFSKHNLQMRDGGGGRWPPTATSCWPVIAMATHINVYPVRFGLGLLRRSLAMTNRPVFQNLLTEGKCIGIYGFLRFDSGWTVRGQSFFAERNLKRRRKRRSL